jgi:hypothetical protein
MVQNQKFESSMFDYCSNQAERAYKLLEDGDIDVGLQYLAHLADVLQMLVEAKSSQGITNINEFAKLVKEMDELLARFDEFDDDDDDDDDDDFIAEGGCGC